MKRIVFAFVLICGLFPLMFSQTTINLSWLKGMGGTTSNDELNGMHVDGSGNIYIAGKIQGLVDLDPGPGTYTVDPNYPHGFFAKYNSNGGLIWATYFDGEGQSNIYDIATDAAGDVYVTGDFEVAPLDFNTSSPGTNTLAPADKDVFIVKYTSNGAFSWVRAIGSPSATLRVYNLKVNSAGEVVIAGDFNQDASAPVNFNPAGPSFTMQPYGYSDAYVAKYSSSGNLLFAEHIGGPKNDYTWGLDLDASDNIYLTGVYKDTIFYGGAPVTNSVVGDFQELFTAKYTSSGSFVWGKSIGGASDDGGYRLKMINNNEFIVSGYMYSNSMDANPSPTATTTLNKVSTATNFDVLLLRFSNATGDLVWAKNTGGDGFVMPYILNADNQGNIFMGGSFQGIIDFDFGAAAQTYTSINLTNRDICLAKYTTNGDFIFNYQMGDGTGPNEAYQVHVSPTNEIVLGGGYSTPVDFDPSLASNSLTLYGGRDIFFNKYNQCIAPDTPTLSVTSTTICANTTATLSITAGNLNSATNWVWSQGSCGTSTIAVGTTATVSPTFPTTYYVRGEGGCITPTVCANASVAVQALKDITGTVTHSLNPVAGLVILYKYEGPLEKWDSVTYQNIQPNGTFTMTTVYTGSYVILCEPSSATLQTTYSPNAIGWKGAQVFGHGCINQTTKNIDVQPLVNIGTGPGVLAGKIVEGVGYGQRGAGITAPGGPIRGMTVKGGRNPGGDIVAQGKTNAAGEYTLSNFPLNTTGESYFLIVDIPGLDTNGTYRRAVITGSTQYTDLDFVVDSMYINPILNFVGVQEITMDDQLIKVYPNPTTGKFIIESDLKEGSEISIRLSDVVGKEIYRTDEFFNTGEIKREIDLKDKENGIYFVTMSLNGRSSRFKLILTK